MRRRLLSFLATTALVAQVPAGLRLGDPCPGFSLPGTDGQTHGPYLAGPRPLLLVVFLSTECPYVMATQGRIAAYARAHEGQVRVVAINANDTDSHARESMADMRAQARGQAFAFPYLKDAAQEVTRAFGAACTPDFFLFDQTGRLAYRGRLDDSWRDATKVTARDLEAATQALLAGRPVNPDQVPSRGCTIKWK